MIRLGACGWSYFPEKGNKLLNYAKHFNVVEVNSSFYRIPRLSTAQRWRELADSVNERFEFTVKAYKGITHQDRFAGNSLAYFEKVKEIAKALRANIILFQTPKSFLPTEENIRKAKAFFSSIDREHFAIAWEVRWKESWRDEIVKDLFEELNIIHAVDPLRRAPVAGNINYFRLHGFGRRMYDYQFSEEELERIAKIIRKSGKETYLFFNNYAMYEDAERFRAFAKREGLEIF